MSLLEIRRLTHSFGENLLYKNAEFALNKGEHIGVVGSKFYDCFLSLLVRDYDVYRL